MSRESVDNGFSEECPHILTQYRRFSSLRPYRTMTLKSKITLDSSDKEELENPIRLLLGGRGWCVFHRIKDLEHFTMKYIVFLGTLI